QRRDVLARGGRVGHVHHAVEALAAEGGAERGGILAVGHQALDAHGQPLGLAPAVEDGHAMAVALERAHEVQADELGAADDEDAHVSRSPPRRTWSYASRR